MVANLLQTRKNLDMRCKFLIFTILFGRLKKNPAITVFDKNDQFSCVQNGALRRMMGYSDGDCRNAAKNILRNFDDVTPSSI